MNVRMLCLALIFACSTHSFAECTLTEAKQYAVADYNNDGEISPVDAMGKSRLLSILNSTLAPTARDIQDFDGNGDKVLSPIDFLIFGNLVDSYLNSPRQGKCAPALLKAYAVMANRRHEVTNDRYYSALYILYGNYFSQMEVNRGEEALVTLPTKYDFNRDGKIDTLDAYYANAAYMLK